MASSILSLKRVAAHLKCASTRRRFCSRSLLQQLADSRLDYIEKCLPPNIVTLESSFLAPDDREIHHSRRHGTGVFLDPKLIVTSAHVVGRLSTLYESGTVEKADGFQHGSILHKSYIGTTVASTLEGRKLKTNPLAVDFTNDLAVLEVVNPEWNLPRHCALVNSPPDRGTLLMAALHKQSKLVFTLGNVSGVGEKTVRAKAPWPLDDGLGWIEHNWLRHGVGGPPPGSILLNSGEKVSGSVSHVVGSPWFNSKGEVVGIASWEAMDVLAKFTMGFAVPPLCIRSMLDYAKMKGPEDPIVMDRWIDAHVIHED